jgi:nitrogen-specific signal transduction histidine kinase
LSIEKRRDKTYGIGLSLTLADKIVTTHQGRLELSGRIGAGVFAAIPRPHPQRHFNKARISKKIS